MIKKLIYGLKDKQLVSIEDVEKGLNCKCICPSCKSLLVAKKGKLKTHHFAHYKSEECENGSETALHLASKEIIKKYKKIIIPKLISNGYSYKGEDIVLSESRLIEFDSVILEKKVSNFIPDIICIINNKKLFIEIAVTHFVDEEKHQKMEKYGTSTIEIDLSQVTDDITKQELENLIINDINNKYWIYNSKEKKLSKSRIDKIKRRETQKESERLRVEKYFEEKLKFAKKEKLEILNFITTAYCPELIINNSNRMTKNYVIDKLRKGENWNGKIYDSFYKTSIWLGYKEIELYPTNLSESERALSNKIFGQLNRIREKSTTNKLKCEKCIFFSGYLDVLNTKFACSYRKKAYNNVYN